MPQEHPFNELAQASTVPSTKDDSVELPLTVFSPSTAPSVEQTSPFTKNWRTCVRPVYGHLHYSRHTEVISTYHTKPELDKPHPIPYC